jgi:hypothetical protein
MKGRSVALAAAVALTGCGALHGGGASNTGSALPEPRSSASLAFDAKTGQLVMFGGAAERSLGDTWVWQSGGWQQVQPSTSPPARENAALGYDPSGGQLVLFGGDTVGEGGGVRTDTWTWDGSTWTQRHPAHHPLGGVSPRMATDAARGVLLLVAQPQTASSIASVETWTWRNGDWHVESSDGAPLAGDFASGSGHQGLAGDGLARPMTGTDFTGSAGMGWDPVSRRVLYVEHNVEGVAPVPHSGLLTWSWDGTWRLEHPATTPPESTDPLVATDRTGVVLFDGDGHTWHWNGTTWAQLDVVGPPPRSAGTIAYDASARVTRIAGGVESAQPGGVYGDTWSWDGAAWSRSAGPALAQAVPQPQPTMPSTHISREQAIAIARREYRELGAVTRVDSGPRSRFLPAGVGGSAAGRVWVWVVVFGNVLIPSEGPRTASPPPPGRGMMVFVDYQTGRSLGGFSPAPAWLLPTPTP